MTAMVAKYVIVSALLLEVAASSACAKSAGRLSEGLLPSPPAIPASTIQSITPVSAATTKRNWDL